MNTIGVIIARFQTASLSDGHRALVQSVKKHYDTIVIVLGVSPVRGSHANPLDFYTRDKMIKKDYPDITVLSIADHPLDSQWSLNLDQLLSSSFPASQCKLYGSPDSFIAHYTGGNEVVALPGKGVQPATLVRDQIGDSVAGSEAFRTGVIYAYSNMYAKVYATVDIAVFRNKRTEVLLGKKTIDHKWRLLGGFSDPTDDNYEMAAARELREEAGPIETTPMVYEQSFRVNDWRYRAETDKIITSLFSTDLVSGMPTGSDDIASVDWFALGNVQKMLNEGAIASEHYPQIEFILKKFNK